MSASATSPAAGVALVTGAAGAIDGAIAAALIEAGFRVALTDRAASVAERAAALGESAWGAALDVTDHAAVPDLIAEAENRLGPLSALVNCAGIGTLTPFLDLETAEWERMLAINLTAPLVWSQTAARAMAPRGGRIVNIASVSGLRAGYGRTAYGTSKAALIHLTRQAALELAPLGITVNAIAPGPVEGPLAASAHSAATVAEYLALIPQGRYARPAEIASLAVFLCGDGAGHVTGQVIAVDGGFSAVGIGVATAWATARAAEANEKPTGQPVHP